MRLARLGEPGDEIPVVEHDGTWRDARAVTDDLDGAFFGRHGPARLRDAAEDLPILDGAEHLRIGAPIARPGAVVCIGMNYAAHAAESGSTPPTLPVIFLKLPNTVVGPDDDVRIPRGSVKTDWEVELGVVIGSRVSYLDSPEQSMDHVAGFVLANDVTERAYQFDHSGGQWSKGKCAATFTPVGPWLVTPDKIDPGNLRLRSFVNGEPRQDSSTADLIFDVPFVIHHLSQYMVLESGDLILTGTPEGVALSGRFPYLSAGDVMRVEIDGLGSATQTCVRS